MSSKRKQLNRALLDGVIMRDIEQVRLSLKQGADANAQDQEHNETALILAAQFADASLMQLLINSGAEIDARDDWGRTALFYAPAASAEFELLLSSGANVQVVDDEGNSILMYKMRQAPSLAEVNELLDLGVDPAVTNNDQETALFIARQYGLQRIVERLGDL